MGLGDNQLRPRRRIDEALSDAGLPPLERSAWVEVDIDALIANAAALRALGSPALLGAVVKADGYGHGLEAAARCAVRGGAEWLCVADGAEAVRLRRDGYHGKVFVLYPVPAAVITEMARLGIDVTMGGVVDAREIAALVDDEHTPLRVHLEVDTGMTRGGVLPEDAAAVSQAIVDNQNLELAGLWTHLAAPEDSAATSVQLTRFQAVRNVLAAAGIEPATVHALASGGLLATDTKYDLTRPGLAFYGQHPGAGEDLPDAMAPALSIKAHPVRIAQVPSGTSVGYAGVWTATRETRVATLPIGYADGWSRASVPGSSVLVEGGRAQLVGRVSSDSLTVDVTDVTDADADSEFTLMGRHGNDEITADSIAEVRGTISWEVLQQLGPRLTRIYTSGGRPVAIRSESTVDVVVAPGADWPDYD